MKRMWSPWRSQYIATFKTPSKPRRGRKSIFALALAAGDDDANMIVWRSACCFVIMNRYPYNSGHVMVVPNRQVAALTDLTPEELADVMFTIQHSVRALTRALAPHGFNIGANLGRVGGAGVDNHIHFHVVPRWNGDTNFMPVLADIKLVSEEMKSVMKTLRKAFREEKGAKTGISSGRRVKR